MTRKCRIHILQTNPWHWEDDSKNDNRDMTCMHNKGEAITLSFFQSEIFANLERTQSTSKLNKYLTLTPTNIWGNSTHLTNSRTTTLERISARTFLIARQWVRPQTRWYSHFSCYVGLDLASTVYSPKHTNQKYQAYKYANN